MSSSGPDVGAQLCTSLGHGMCDYLVCQTLVNIMSMQPDVYILAAWNVQ